MQNTKSNKYLTFEEASEAAQKLGIKGSNLAKEYEKRYKEDPKLPSSPVEKYKKDWISWTVFLGEEIKEYYETYEEASLAAQKLGIITKEEYGNRYKEDPKLPSSPAHKYKNIGWNCYPVFLGTDK